MRLETLDWYVADAVERKLEDEEVWGNRSPEVIAEIATKVKQNMVKVAMVSISKVYMEDVIESHIDLDNL